MANYKPKYDIPDFEGLTLRRPLGVPMTARWYKRVTSWERNGFFNIWTIRLNQKVKYWLFLPVVVWGVVNHVFTGIYYDNYDFSQDRDFRVYDKLTLRNTPEGRVWSRPG